MPRAAKAAKPAPKTKGGKVGKKEKKDPNAPKVCLGASPRSCPGSLNLKLIRHCCRGLPAPTSTFQTP